MTTFAVMNLDARYTVSQELALVFLTVWTASFEGAVIGMFGSRTCAEHACHWHHTESLCFEEA